MPVPVDLTMTLPMQRRLRATAYSDIPNNLDGSGQQSTPASTQIPTCQSTVQNAEAGITGDITTSDVNSTGSVLGER
jgi:hypothetical protein